MMKDTLIKTYQNSPISFLSDGWVNATEMGKAFDTRPVDFLRHEQAKRFIAALQDTLAEEEKTKVRNHTLVPVEIIRVVKGGRVGEAGTWMHPLLAVQFAQWCSPHFGIWCSRIMLDVLAGKTITPERADSLMPGIGSVKDAIDALWDKTVSNGTVTMRIKSIHGTPTQISDLIYNQTGELVSPSWIGRAARIGVVSALVTRSATARHCVINRPI